MTKFYIVAPRGADGAASLYTEARIKGLEVSHYPSLPCRVFDGSPKGALGVFRAVGALVFYKDERRWEVLARTDADAVDLATLIELGLQTMAKYGRQPGHWTRKSWFEHRISARTEKRIAWARVCYQLDTEDLLHTATASSADVDVDDLVTRVLESAETS